MRSSPLSFGSVLFDELEQIAARRGGFASLLALKDEVAEVQRAVAGSVGAATAAGTKLRSVRDESDRLARDAGAIIERVAGAARAVDELGQLVRVRCETAIGVLGKLRPYEAPRGRPGTFPSLTGFLRTVAGLVQVKDGAPGGHARQERIRRRIEELKDRLKKDQSELDTHRARQCQGDRGQRAEEGPLAGARAAGEQFARLCRLARGLKSFKELEGRDAEAAGAARRLLDRSHNQDLRGRGAEEQLIRAAAVQRARALEAALDAAVEQLDRTLETYRCLARVSRGVAAEIRRLVENQPDAARYEIYDMLEDGARKACMRLEAVGLAFSGGGIRSATFNLGFLQGMASLGLLKRFDYLSTVSGGGYIGAWFAAWVRREGGKAGDPVPPTDKDIDREARQLIDQRRADPLATPPTPPPELVEQWVATAAERIRERVRATLQQAYDARRRAFDELPLGERSTAPEPPGEDDIAEAAEPLIAEEARRIGNTAAQRYLEETTHAEVKDLLWAVYEAELRAKRRRTANALENVEKQLNTSRISQATATRRWVTATEVAEGREQVSLPPPSMGRIVEEEPGPIHHLRSYSNYLAPRLGALSIDTWTMISVYLRNVLLNQFILLPMMLAAITVPRLLLLLFATDLHGPALALLQGWADVYAGWPMLVAALAILPVPKAVDFFAREGLRRLEARDPRNTGRALVALLALGAAALAWGTARLALVRAEEWADGTRSAPAVRWLAHNTWAAAAAVLLPFVLTATFWRRGPDAFAAWLAGRLSLRIKAWTILLVVVLGTTRLVGAAASGLLGVLDSVPGWMPAVLLASLAAILAIPARWLDAAAARSPRLPARMIRRVAAVAAAIGVVASAAPWLTGKAIVFALTALLAWLGFQRTYRTVALIRESRRPASIARAEGASRFDLPFPILWEQILIPFALVALGVSLLFSRPGWPLLVRPLPHLGAAFEPASWGGWIFPAAACFGALVGGMRLLAFALIDIRDRLSDWGGFERLGRAAAAFASGLIVGTALAATLMKLAGWLAASPHTLEAVLLAFGPPMVLLAIGAGSAIEVGLVGGYGDEDMREWRASLGAYLLIMGVLWAGFAALSIFGPLLIAQVHEIVAWVAGAGWLITSISGALAGRSDRTDGARGGRSALEYLALAAPVVFIVGLIVSIAMLATTLQGVAFPTGRGAPEAHVFLGRLAEAGAPRTWALLLASAWVAAIGCVYVNINLFSLNAFYANRLVRCYLGASRPAEAPAEGRPTFAPTDSPVPVRRPNPITGFDPTDDFPMHDLAVVRTWRDEDLVVDYRGPYHLVNTSMNLVAGSELAWQERMAESFVISPLYCGSKTTGYRPNRAARRELDLAELEAGEAGRPDDATLPGYGGDIRLGTAVSVSGAAASPNAGYHSSPLVAILMTVLNARLGLWLGNPARDAWRRSGPGFAYYLLDELFGRTTSKGNYIYLSDGGHFENLGVYELIRRRCRHIVLCDAGADPDGSFWDLGSLVRKCREDFGVRIEIDIGPLLKKEGSSHAKWHCAVGRIHYEDVGPGAHPGTLFYVKPALTGDEPSDVRNYVVNHPTFPHESTADQFFGESQFESYRALGEHTAVHVFGDVVRDAGPAVSTAQFFSRLRRRWFPVPPDLDKNLLKSVKAFVDVHKEIRGDPRLEHITQDLYDTELAGLGGERAEVHAVIQMLQAMENAWIAVDLESFSDHPLNRGWMNVFRRWTSSRTLQRHWPAIRGEFSEGFVRFCENELNLTVPEPGVIWLDDGPAEPGREAADFRAAIERLDQEFRLEWPQVTLREIGDGHSTLIHMFDHARRFPALRGPAMREGRARVGLIIRGGGNRHDDPTAEPSEYGTILAWEADDGVIDLVVWIRGAYRTLGLGGAIARAIESLKRDLQKASPQGYTLRTRYPGDERIKGTQRWQSNLWYDFFQNRGFHLRENDHAGDDMATLYYHYEP